MIGRLVGRVVADDGGVLVVDVNGVGYEVTVPLGTLGRAPLDDDGRVTLVVHTHVREDAFTLFAFASEADRATFRVLLGVTNVGPKLALAVLGALPPPELATVLARADVKALSTIPGIGKKTAEKILFELKDKAIPAASRDGSAKATAPRPAALSGNAEPLGSPLKVVASPTKARRLSDESSASSSEADDALDGRSRKATGLPWQRP